MVNEHFLNESPKLTKLLSDLKTWLEDDNWTSKDVIRWLKGYAFPRLNHEEEPFNWIVWALTRLDGSYNSQMSERIAAYLENYAPYKEQVIDQKLLYNLFYLCANLYCDRRLADSLADVYDFLAREENRGIKKVFLSKDRMFNVGSAFREALISNQIDDKYLTSWKMLLEGLEPDIIRGDVFSGFRGIVHKPSPGQIITPDVDEIGWALKKVSEYLSNEIATRAEKFHHLTDYIRRVWYNYSSWSETFAYQAQINSLPDWAIENCPYFPVQLTAEENSQDDEYIVWSIVRDGLTEIDGNGFWVINEDQFISQIRLYPESADLKEFLHILESLIGHTATNAPGGTYSFFLKAVNEEFLSMEKVFQYEKRPAFEKAIKKIRSYLHVFMQSKENQAYAREVFNVVGTPG